MHTNVPAEKFSPSLTDLKLSHDKQIPWGQLYAELSKSHKVMEFAWKDATVVLFLSTVHDGQNYVAKLRRRPATTNKGYRQTVKMFRNQPRAVLDIPEFIEEYNLWMCGVDIADQLRSYYNINRVYRKTWKPLFSFLLDIAVGNSYMLSSYRPEPGSGERALRRDSHLQFCRDLRDALLHASVCVRKPPSKEGMKGWMDIVWKPVREHQLVKQFTKQPTCAACSYKHRTSSQPHRGNRKPLADLSINTTMKSREDSRGWKRRQRPPRTNWGCSVCHIPLCKKGRCWSEHVAKLTTKD
ncbi:uncharacterized protein BDZ99DRAFT_478014 [Mytilinidion resinicola]|uniref:PiggyBac transposable element-derived protein domain-containing protein n=1 Tax=Mytilinidion resinicola TaxID=574789 RepID=A0A6A6YIZ9_9PEZI|nr:uncharacterized protein BDZ99DRAFT_478014 [Mytilinidion resinicola]KAF2808528.1 hypothetical protein BDZ99DRAFT_478014 [Mytilinidion resinicola]